MLERFSQGHEPMYYENLEVVRLIGANHKLVTYLSIGAYNKKFTSFKEQIIKMKSYCNMTNNEILCDNYNKIITSSYNEIDEQRNRLLASLGGENKFKNRKRRGSINIIGTAMNTLFGVRDDNCVQSTAELIKETEEGTSNVLHILKSQTTVVKTALNKIGKSLNETNALYEILRGRQGELYNKTKENIKALAKEA